MKRYTEKTISFDLPDSEDKRIEGKLLGELNRPVVVIMHGRPGSPEGLPYYLYSRYVHEQLGMSALRLAMYGGKPDQRNLMDCTLDTHAADFETVVDDLHEQGVEQVSAVGHSYGGLTILKSKAKLAAAVLWDAAHGSYSAKSRDAESERKYPEETVDERFRIGTSGAMYVYPQTNLEYDKQLGDTSHLAAKDYPLKIIAAGKGVLKGLNKEYYEHANEPKSYVTVADGSHGFMDSDEVMGRLFEETTVWLRDYAQRK